MKSRNFIFLTGGLGNQLFQISAALSAQETIICPNPFNGRLNSAGNLDIEDLHIGSSVQIKKNPPLGYFSLKVINFTLRFFGSQSADEPKKLKNVIVRSVASIVLSLKFKKTIFVEANLGLGYDPHALEEKIRQTFHIGYFQTYKTLGKPEVLTTLRNICLKDGSESLQEFTALSIVEKPLVVHVRLGDYLEADKFGILPADYYSKAINEAFQNGDYNRIWLFSDGPIQALSRIPEQFQPIVRVIPDLEGSTSLTFEVMRLGDGFVIANSTFSWWAAAISRNRYAPVYCPDKWFKEIESPRDLIPPHWQRIASWT